MNRMLFIISYVSQYPTSTPYRDYKLFVMINIAVSLIVIAVIMHQVNDAIADDPTVLLLFLLIDLMSC